MSESAELIPNALAFERLATLAVSSMAEVELCRVVEGEHIGAPVAVKRLPIDLVEDDQLRRMFHDEIWMAASVDHPSVARVLGWGEDERGPYLVSEFVRGVSLSRLMRTVFNTGEHFTERLVAYLASRICAGLAAAHDLRGTRGELLGFVHRDLTPGNVLLGFDGSVKITDFGLAKAKRRVTHTAVGVTKGDPAYMSPEQVMAQPLDGRSDIFALGVVMYELFAQELPWKVRSVREALTAIVHGPRLDLGAPCPRVDSVLVGVVNRCLARPIDERPQNVHVLLGELSRWLELHGHAESQDHLARFVRRNAMRQMRWIERVMQGEAGESHDGESSAQELSRIETPPERSGAGASGRSGAASPSTEARPGQGAAGTESPRASGAAPPPPRATAGSAPGPSPASPPHGSAATGSPPAAPGRPSRPEIADPESATTLDRPPVPVHDPDTAPTRQGVGMRPHPPPGTPSPPAEPSVSIPGSTTEPYVRRSRDWQAIRAAAQQITAGASELAARAQRASDEARAASEAARAAAQQAGDQADRASRAADAVSMIERAMTALDRGDEGEAKTLLAQAHSLYAQAAR